MSILKHLTSITFVCFLRLSIVMPTASAEDTKQESLDRLVTAILLSDFEMFISEGTEEFKNGMTESQFDAFSDNFKHLSAEGYSSEYLTDLSQGGFTVFLWKLTHEESDDDMLARLVLSDDKVAGFWLQ